MIVSPGQWKTQLYLSFWHTSGLYSLLMHRVSELLPKHWEQGFIEADLQLVDLHCLPTADPAVLGMGSPCAAHPVDLLGSIQVPRWGALPRETPVNKLLFPPASRMTLRLYRLQQFDETKHFSSNKRNQYLLWIMTQHICYLRKSITLFLYFKCKGHGLIQDFSVLALLTFWLNDSLLVDGGWGCLVVLLVSIH